MSFVTQTPPLVKVRIDPGPSALPLPRSPPTCGRGRDHVTVVVILIFLSAGAGPGEGEGAQEPAVFEGNIDMYSNNSRRDDFIGRRSSRIKRNLTGAVSNPRALHGGCD